MKAHTLYGPPGCGKTTEMLRRLGESAKKIAKGDIAFLSFTKAGANEALKRLNITRSDKICTIHSLMFRLTGCTSQAVVDLDKMRQFGQKTGLRFRGTSNDTSEQMETGDQYISVLSKAQNTMRSLRDEYYESNRPGNWAEFEWFSKTYTEWKKANGYLDFNDMLSRYLKTPVNHGARHVYIDEAQDLSNLQWRVIDRLLDYPQVEEAHVAGDDDQAIYEWSGANTHGMAEFEERYKADRQVLTQSWRVPTSVHELALQVVGTIKKRVAKEYRPRDEVGSVRRHIRFDSKTIQNGEDTLILCRNYLSKGEIEEQLINERIPYRSDSGAPGLFNSRVADAIRVFKKLDNGDSVSQSEIERMSYVANDHTKRDIAAREFGAMLKRGYMRCFKIRPDQVEFYRDADFTAEPTVRLSTIHGAKGRESDRVVLHTGLTLKTLKEMDTNPDAEARVWYVGVTRARHSLDIIEAEAGYGL